MGGLGFLDLLSSGTPVFRIFLKVSTRLQVVPAKAMMSLVLCPARRRMATFSLLGFTTIILKIIINCL